MQFQRSIFQVSGGPNPIGPSMVVIGLTMILFGWLVITMPEILAYLVGGFFIFIGAGLFTWGLTVRRIEKATTRVDSDTIEIIRD